ncbi:MAG: SusC/RagA family TonB-linked outer membrane protein [Bacteroidales bacterium]|nr:SusC/RagA family TonB-linked outer membrane protein [Bacteroidales bacterium]
MKQKLLTCLLMLATSVCLMAQNVTVTGVVSDQMGPVIGASVFEKGTTNGTVTDLDGNFSLSVNPDGVLVISSIGYTTQEIPVGTQRVFNVFLEEDNEFLDEVVVVGYGTQKKKLVTGSTVQVKGEDLAKLNSTNALGAMQSSTPGVSIMSSSGQPGSGYNVNIRGMGTIGSYSPLYVIDGVAGGSISSLNASDIESIDVLKDAASCAIYGARGANGVILVTTKQGKSGSMTVTYDGFYGIQNVQKMPEFLNAQQYMDIQDQVNFNNGTPLVDWQAILNPALYNSIKDGSFKGTNWLDLIRNVNAPTTNHAVNIVGGTDLSKFSMGVSYANQQGIFGKPVASDYHRLTVRLNSDHVLWRKNGRDIISFGENVTFTQTKNSGIGTGNHYWNDIFNMLSANPLVPAYQEDGSYTEYDYLQNSGVWNLVSTISNPIAEMVYSSRGNNESHGYSLNMSANLRVQPIAGLTWKSQFNYGLDSGSYRQYSMIYKLTNQSFKDTDAVSQSAYAGWSWSWENTINYVFTLGQNHHFDALIGNTLQHSGFGESVEAANTTSLWPNMWQYAYVGNTSGDPGLSDIGGSTWGDSGLVSFFGRVNYDFAEKYMFSAILRIDGSSNFMRGHRWGIFPSFSAGWVISNEDWWNSSLVNFFKLRGSWGQNGNCNIDNFQYLSTISVGAPTGGYSFYTGQTAQNSGTGAFADKLANPDITWETSQQLDLGFDARLFHNKLNVAFDWYQKDTKNWLVNAPIMGHFGANAPYINGGDVRNSGVEIALNWSDARSQDFSYTFGVNAAYNKNRVTRIANDEGIIHGSSSVVQGIAEMYRAQVGYPIGYFWTYATDGVFQNQAEIDAWKGKGLGTIVDNVVPGDLKFIDQNKDGIINDDDKTMTGDPNPDWNVGLNFSVYFKGFDFALSGYGMFGQQVFRAYRRYTDSQWNNYTTEVFDYWHGEGTSNRYPRLVPGTNYNYMNNTDIFIEDADFFRIQTVTLGYDLKRLWKNAPFGQARFYVQAQNPWVFTKYKGLDPEVGSSSGFSSWAKGIDLGYYPQARTYLVGLNLSFGGNRRSGEIAHVDERVVEKLVEKVIEKEVVREVPVEVVKEVKVPGKAEFKGPYTDDLFFVINKAEIRPDEAFKLGQIAQILKDNPDATITITGYADSGTGNKTINQDLSEQRAQTVVDMLKKAGISASRIISKAVGGDRDASRSPESNRVAVCIVK